MILINAGRSRRGWSTYSNWLFCPQKGAFTAEARNDDAPLGTVSPPLQKGSLWHVCLAHHYARIREMLCKGDPDQFYTPREAVEMVAEKGGVEPELVTNVLNIFSDYVAHFEEIDQLIMPVSIEQEYEAEIYGNDYTMRMDGVFRHNDGLIYIYDHKHTYKVDKATEMKYTLSGQFMGAQWFGAKIWGKEFGGVILNLSCSYPMSAGSKKLQFLRRPLPAAPAMFERFPDTIRYAADQMKRFAGLKLDAYPRAMNEQICMTAYGPCDFFDRCRWGK